METANKAVFFDRDGILNQLVERDGSLYSPQNFTDFNIFSESIDVIKGIKELGFLAIVVSNQPDIARGIFDQSELEKMTEVLFKELDVDDVFYCTHDDIDDCDCRKPKPGLFHLAQKKYNINFDSSIMVGDTWKDVDAAKNANIKMYLLNTNYNQDIQQIERIDTLSGILTKI
jgi:D-glycero-D-manno-heptose 1,7-bisphosphate phosphatase